MLMRFPSGWIAGSIRLALPLLLGMLAVPRAALALPSFTRQTGVPCAQCHAVGFGPQLTPFGRQFKLNGYVWGDSTQRVPLSLMTIIGTTHTAADLADAPEHYGRNDNFAMNELTGFLAGRLAPHLGAFAEVSYSGTERSTAWGAFDVRSAWTGTVGGHGYVAGVTLNDNPTVTDLWNSTPVWSFPFTASELAPTPTAAPLLYDGISERVLGPSFYAMLDNHYYVEIGAYKSLNDALLRKVGASADDNLHMRGVAPYLRAVAQFDHGAHDISFGLTALDSKLRPDTAVAADDSYADIGLDGTYQYLYGSHAVIADLALVHERQHLHASFASGNASAVAHSLDSARFDLTYALNRSWSGSLGLFATSGTRDDALYAPAQTDGSANGSPRSNGYTLQLEYIPFGKAGSFGSPWVNARLGIQYTGYGRFNGGTGNYDGFGRSASDNDTLFVFAWLAI